MSVHQKVAWRLQMVCLLLSAFVVASPALAQTKPPLAVLEFRGTKIDIEVLATMSDSVREGSLAVKGRNYDVMTRENMMVLMKNMGGTGKCEEGECEVETARSISAKLFISGQVVRIEGTYVVTLKLYETDRGTLLASKQIEAKDQLEANRALSAAAEALVRKGLGLESGPAASSSQSVVSPGPASVTLSAPLMKLAEVPALPESLGNAGAMKLEVSTDVLVAYDAALKADKLGKAKPDEAAAAWAKVAKLTDGNPYQANAKQRHREWLAYAAQNKTLDARKRADAEQLRKILPLESVASEQKSRLVLTFASSYGVDEAVALADKVEPADRDKVCRLFPGKVEVLLGPDLTGGVKVFIDGKDMGKTPGTFGVTRCARVVGASEESTGKWWEGRLTFDASGMARVVLPFGKYPEQAIVRFKATSENETYEPQIEADGKVLTCDQPVIYSRPCVVKVRPGPVVLRTAGSRKLQESVTLLRGENEVHVEVGWGGGWGSFALMITSLAVLAAGVVMAVDGFVTTGVPAACDIPPCSGRVSPLSRM